MKRNESNIILTIKKRSQGVYNTYRLIKTPIDSASPSYSLFLSTVFNGTTDEEFFLNFANSSKDALIILRMLVNGNVTACTLQDTLRDLLLERNMK